MARSRQPDGVTVRGPTGTTSRSMRSAVRSTINPLQGTPLTAFDSRIRNSETLEDGLPPSAPPGASTPLADSDSSRRPPQRPGEARSDSSIRTECTVHRLRPAQVAGSIWRRDEDQTRPPPVADTTVATGSRYGDGAAGDPEEQVGVVAGGALGARAREAQRDPAHRIGPP